MQKYTSVIIGHTSMDTNTDHLGHSVKMLGGAVLYSSAAAHALGYHVAAVTKLARKDADRLNSFSIERGDIFPVWGVHSTSISNTYHTADKETRTCVCTKRGDPFMISDFPNIQADTYQFAGLLYGDFFDESIVNSADKGKVALDVQGCLRRVNPQNGTMYFRDWEDKRRVLPYITFLKTDAAEAEILTGLTDRAEAAKLMHEWGAKEVLITHNTEVLAYDGKDFFTCPIRSRNLSGRTGRGDTTFAAYINERTVTDIKHALLTATATVSLKMETPGQFKGTRENVENYIKEFYPDYDV